MSQVDVDAIVPVFRRDRLQRMAIIVAGIVDQDVNGADCGECVCNRRQVSEIATMVARQDFSVVQRADEGVCIRISNIEEQHLGALSHKAAHEARSNAGRAARDDDALSPQAGIVGRRHGDMTMGTRPDGRLPNAGVVHALGKLPGATVRPASITSSSLGMSEAPVPVARRAPFLNLPDRSE